MTSYPIKQNGKTLETHYVLKTAEIAFWTLTAHELKNGRDANLELDTRSSHGVTPPEQLPLASWIKDVLREHELCE